MTLPHQVGLGREAAGGRDSRFAADAHAREWDAIMHPIPKVSRARKAVYISLPVLAVLGAVVWFWSKAPDPYTVDTTTPRGALGAYIDALHRGEPLEVYDLLCKEEREYLVYGGFVDTTASVVQDYALEPDPALLWDAEPREDGRYVVRASVKDRSSNFWVVPEADGQYRVCGFASED